MVRYLMTLIAANLLTLSVVPSAEATETPGPTSTATASTTPNGLITNGEQAGSDSTHPGAEDDGDGGGEETSTLPPGNWVRTNDACDTVGASGCVVGYVCDDGSTPSVWIYVTADGPLLSDSLCPEDPEPTPNTPPVDIPGEALEAFKKVELPESTITVQPPGGETLVNFKTILSTQAERHQVSVHLTKVNIDLVLDVWPSHFVWHHGDGTVQESASTGRTWTQGADVDGDGFITHIYNSTLEAAPVSVDTTWSAQFKVVGDAGWRPVNGTVTKVGATVPLTIREATPELVTEPN